MTGPSFLQLSPYTDYSDSLNLSRGNPNLKPQFTNSFEMAYQLNYQKNTFLASVYYKYTTDLITRYQTKEINPLTDSVVLDQHIYKCQFQLCWWIGIDRKKQSD